MATIACLCVCPLSSADAATIISADFEGIATGAATAALLNGEVTGGTWAVNNIDNSIVREGGGNQVFNPDNGPYDYDLGTFPSAPLDGAVISYDTYIQRTQSNQVNIKKNFLVGTDTDDNEVFRLVMQTDGTSNSNPGRLSYVDASGTEVHLISGLPGENGNGFNNSKLENVRLEFNTTGFDIYHKNVLLLADAEYRSPFGAGAGSVDDLAKLSFSATEGSAGAFYDNLTIDVTAVPEPSSLLLTVFGFLGLLCRRRQPNRRAINSASTFRESVTI
jgi:hypothetical protein